MTIKQSLFSVSLLILLNFFYSTTTSAQLSPIQAPAAAPPIPTLPQSPPTSPPAPPAAAPATAPAAAAVPASAPGMNTVPLVPVTPSAAPTPTVTVPKGPTIDIVQILRKAKGFSVLIRLLKTTQLINQLNSQLMTSGSGGLTIFAPDDSGFSKLKAGFLNSLNDRQKVELLQFHTISTFIAISNFDTLTNPVQTQAGDDSQRLQLNVTTYGGNSVSMTTGAVNASVTGTVYTDNKLAIYKVDKVLLPLDIVLPKAKAPAPALAAAAAKGDSPKSDKQKASGAESGDDTTDNDDNTVPADTTSGAGSMSFNADVKWVPLVLGVAFVAGAMI